MTSTRLSQGDMTTAAPAPKRFVCTHDKDRANTIPTALRGIITEHASHGVKRDNKHSTNQQNKQQVNKQADKQAKKQAKQQPTKRTNERTNKIHTKRDFANTTWVWGLSSCPSAFAMSSFRVDGSRYSDARSASCRSH